MAAYRKALALNPQDPRPYNNLAYLYAEQRRNLDEALGLARRAAELAPKNASVQDTLGWVYLARGQMPEAERSLTDAVALAPQQPTIRYHLGVAHYQRGQKAEAAAAFRRALELGKFSEEDAARKLLRELGG